MRVDYLGNNELVVLLKDPVTKKVIQKIYIDEEDGVTFVDVVDGQEVHSEFWCHEATRTFRLPPNRCRSKSSGIRCIYVNGHIKQGTRPMHGAPIGTGFGEWGDEPRRKKNATRKKRR